MFELSHQKAMIKKFNSRIEIHGEEHVPAGDIKLSWNMAAGDVLPYFAPTLRWSLYHKAGAQDLANETHDAPNLRYKHLGPLKWDVKLGPGYVFTVHLGTGTEGSDLTIGACLINGFTIDPQEGGTVVMACTIQCKPDTLQAGRLCMLQQQENLEVSLTPPAADAQVDDEDDDDGDGDNTTASGLH